MVTSLELSVIEDELEALEGGFVQKVYQRGEELTLEIYVPGDEKKRLIVGKDRIFLTEHKRNNPERPPGFCMELRKHLGRVDEFRQRGFDRILVLESGDTKLILELFGKGNYILTKGDTIIGALREQDWENRTIRVGETYKFPEPVEDPRENDPVELLGEGELVRQAAKNLSLGGKYAEELVKRTGIDKETETSDLTENQKDLIRQSIEEMFSDYSPRIYTEEMVAAPFKMQTVSGEHEETDTLLQAFDRKYTTLEKQRKEEKRLEKYREKKEGLERQLEQQKRKIEGLKKSSEENREKAEKIYRNYNELSEAKRSLERGLEKEGWDSVKKKVEEADTPVKGLNEQEEFFSYRVEGENLKIYLFQDLEATASEYYDKAKASENKVENAEKALRRTRDELEALDPGDFEGEQAPQKKEKRSKKWFEKYRWFYSSEGFLVLAGRDSQTNEMLVKKHMDGNDLYFHADFDAAPSVVVKDGKEAGEATLEEAAKFAVAFSSVWKRGIGSASAYYVDPDQVTKNPESGEYVGKGAFIIRGEREYIRNVAAEAAVGPYEIEGVEVPMSGPRSALEQQCPSYIEIRPGREKKSEVAKEIRSRMREQGHELDLDYLIRALPPGTSEIKSD